MNKINYSLVLLLVILCHSCGVRKKAGKQTVFQQSNVTESTNIYQEPKRDSSAVNDFIAGNRTKPENMSLADTTFVNLSDYSADFVYDMKYATSDNFLKTKVYECSACYLRLKTVKALVKANEKFMKRGFRIVLYDCYRPLSVQKKMWTLVPNPEYVADPKKGSIHNRGGAVDIGLVDQNGKKLDMGTPFDHFGIESSHDYENLSEEIKANRKLLRKIMTQCDFRIFESEWWHYNLRNAHKNPVSNFSWKCD